MSTSDPSLRILFVWPDSPYLGILDVLPLGIGYLAANLPARYGLRLCDMALRPVSLEDLLAQIGDYHPHLIAFSTWGFNLNSTAALAQRIKAANPRIPIMVGGPEPSAQGEQILADHPEFDFAIAGEGEFPFAEFLRLLEQDRCSPDDLQRACIPGLLFRKDGRVRASEGTTWRELSDLKPCDFAFIDLEAYFSKGYSYGFHARARRTAPVATTRGCPYDCSFCSARKINGRKLRCRSLDSVVTEIQDLQRNFGVDGFNIIDDNFTFDIRFAKEVCRRIIQLDLPDVSFNCPNGVRLERLDQELLELMKQAGWDWIFIAPESGSEKTLRRMKKAMDLHAVVEKIKLIHAAGLHVFGFFIIGYPGETRKDIGMTFRFARRAGFDGAVFTAFHPLRGTPVYEELERNGELRETNLNSDYYEVSYAPAGMTPFELRCLRLYGTGRFYLSSLKRLSLILRHKSMGNILLFARKLIAS